MFLFGSPPPSRATLFPYTTLFRSYTIDGGPLGELQYESFNAAAAKVTFKGSNVHPGTAKNKMVNSAKLATEFIEMFPDQESPEHTEGYEGFRSEERSCRERV